MTAEPSLHGPGESGPEWQEDLTCPAPASRPVLVNMESRQALGLLGGVSGRNGSGFRRGDTASTRSRPLANALSTEPRFRTGGVSENHIAEASKLTLRLSLTVPTIVPVVANVVEKHMPLSRERVPHLLQSNAVDWVKCFHSRVTDFDHGVRARNSQENGYSGINKTIVNVARRFYCGMLCE